MGKFEQPYWSEWSNKIIEGLSLKRHGKEWHGSCPNCGGNDRFWINELDGLVKTHCRQCEDFKAIQTSLNKMGLWVSLDPIPDNIIEFKPQAFPMDTPYHIRKGVELGNARLEGSNVVIDLYNTQQQVVGKQTITPDGQKKFNAGLDKSQGVFGVCGTLSQGICYVAEGWATSQSVSQSLERPCIFALDANNLPTVVEKISEVWPQLELVIAADNDEKGIEAAKATKRPWKAPALEGADWNDVFTQLGKNAVAQSLNNPIRPGLRLFQRMAEIELRPPEWLIDGVFETDSLSIVFGASGAGKTFVTLDVAMHIASGKAYHGKAVRKSPVAYIAGEGNAGFARRVAAWCQLNQVDLAEVPFFKSTAPITLSNDAIDEIIENLKAIIEAEGNLGLLVLDTLDRTIEGVEDKNEDTKAYLDLCDRVRGEIGCTVLIVAHVGHAAKDRAKGSTKLKDRMDASYKVEAWGDHKIIMTPTKMKDADEPEPMAFIKIAQNIKLPNGEQTDSLALEVTTEKPLDKNSVEYAQSIVEEQMRRLAEFGECDRIELRDAVAIELECTKRHANRAIKKMIDAGKITDVGGVLKWS